MRYTGVMESTDAGRDRFDVPVEVRRFAEQRRLRVTWRDGHVSEYDYAYLRGWCPCAVCQGHGGERRFITVDNPELRGLSVVGNYALCLTWGDGHDTGIYSYRYLRQRCPCDACAGGSPSAT